MEDVDMLDTHVCSSRAEVPIVQAGAKGYGIDETALRCRSLAHELR